MIEIKTRYQRSLSSSQESCLAFLLCSDEGSGAELVAEALAARLGLYTVVSSARKLVGDTSGSTEALLKREASCVGENTNLWLLTNVRLLAYDREGSLDYRAIACLQSCLSS